MKIQKLIFIIPLLFLIISCGETKTNESKSVSKPVSTNTPTDWKSISTDVFKISHPTNWIADQSGEMGTKFFLFAPQDGTNDQFNENINLMTEKLPNKSIDLDTYVEASEKQIKQYIDDAKIISSERLNINGKEYQNVSYTGTQSNMTLRFQQYYTVYEGVAYILTLTCKQDTYEKFNETGTQIMNTFELR